MKIYHAADIHLGRRRLDGRLPDADIAKSFRFIAEEAIAEKSDVFLLAGDLFDRPQVEPPHLRQAQEVLGLLKAARVPVIAIEGNHDRQFVNTEVPTWVRFLADDDLLILLRPEFHATGVCLNQWDAASRNGAWIDIGGVRFVGAGYLGAATPGKVRQIVSELKVGMPHVLLLHAGPEYFVGEGGGIGREDIQWIKERICYLALGHIHKPMIYGGWACNPGSPENCELREAGYSKGKDGKAVARGYAVVEIDPASPAQPISLEVRSSPRRPCLRVELDCSDLKGESKDGHPVFEAGAAEAIRSLKADPSAVVELALTGGFDLKKFAVDPAESAVRIATHANVFVVSIDTSRLNMQAGLASGTAALEGLLPRDELERRAILDLLDDHPLCGLTERGKDFADLFYELKESVRLGQSVESMGSMIFTSHLVEEMRVAAQKAVLTDRHEGRMEHGRLL